MKKISAIIADYLKANGVTKASLAKKLNESPQNLNKKLSKNELTTDYIFSISVALKHNFFAEMADQFNTYMGSANQLKDELSGERPLAGSVSKNEELEQRAEIIRKEVERQIQESQKNENSKNEHRNYIKVLEENNMLLRKISELEKTQDLDAGHGIRKLKKV